MEYQNLRPAQQCGIEFKRRVLRCCPDQRDRAILDKGQEAILLRAVEAVNFVNEQQSALASPAMIACSGEDFFQIGHARKHGRNHLKAKPDGIRQQAGNRRLPRPRRPP